ncbi:hypothetical protein J6590_039386 [Homalodisca vitripennis]|nr:hypothetical protein J6590_039386 [Homalodisca vitripennis]
MVDPGLVIRSLARIRAGLGGKFNARVISTCRLTISAMAHLVSISLSPSLITDRHCHSIGVALFATRLPARWHGYGCDSEERCGEPRPLGIWFNARVISTCRLTISTMAHLVSISLSPSLITDRHCHSVGVALFATRLPARCLRHLNACYLACFTVILQ